MKTNPYLIQRLKAPRNPTPFDFGGGKLNGGISKEAMSVLSQVFSFDYMGSAEFEWGAVPKALDSLSKLDLVKSQEGKVFIICPKEIEQDVKDWIKLASEGRQGHTKEFVGLKEVLEGRKYPQTKGWLKIEEDRYCEEPFMFFVDQTMFENTCKLFGIE